MRPLALLLIVLALPADAVASGGWNWPVRGELITQYRNGDDPYSGGQHRGIDVAAPVGAPVVAATSGTIQYAGVVGSSGLVVSQRSADDGHVLSYLHLSSASVRRGEQVAAGERLGEVGVSGERSAEPPHLHFGVREAGDRHGYLDPLRFLAPPPVEAPQPRPVPVPVPAGEPVRPEPAPAAEPGAATAPAPALVALPSLGPAPAPGHAPAPSAGPSAPGRSAARGIATALGVPGASPVDRAAPSKEHAPEIAPGAGPVADRPAVAAAPGDLGRRPESSGSGGLAMGWLAACAGLVAASALLAGPRGARRGQAPVRMAFGALLRAASRG
jgi:hypothetical protein